MWNSNYIEYEDNDDRNKNLSVKEYLDKIKPYLTDVITNPQKSGTWKVQLTIEIKFLSSTDVDEERITHLKNNNKTFMTYANVNDVIDELLESLLPRYQSGLETSVRGNDFIFDSVRLLY